MKYTFMNCAKKKKSTKQTKPDIWRLQVRIEKNGRGKFGRNT